MFKMNSLKSWIGFAFCLLSLSRSVHSDLFPLSLIHINDFHARFEPTDTAGGTCDDGEECIGGYARTVHTVRRLLEERKDYNPVYLNAGDSFQGTLWYNIGRWNVTSQFLNLLPADAMTLGNHEFDHKIEGLVPFLETIDSPMLVANIDDSEEPAMQGKYQKSMIIERNGRKIGLIGVVLEKFYDLADTGKLKFLNESDVLIEEAQKLKQQGANIIIALTHCGYDVDKIIAANAGAEIDVIVGSHSHTFLFTGDDLPGPDRPRGDYPTQIIHQSSGHRVLIVQAAAYAKYVGNITVFFDENGDIVSFEGAPIYMGKDIKEDEEVLMAMIPWKETIDETGNVVVGASRVTLEKWPCSSRECNLGNFFTDAMVHSFVSISPYDQKPWSNVSIGLVNSGALRVPLYKGNAIVLDSIKPWKALIDESGNRVIGETKVKLEKFECSSRECNLGNFFTDAMVHAFVKRTPYDFHYWSNVSIALTTQGNFRVPIEKGNITYSHLVAMCPFENRFVALNLYGSILKEVLEIGVAAMNSNSQMPSSSRMLQVSGLRVTYNISKPAGDRVKEVLVWCQKCKIPKPEKLDAHTMYRVVVSDYLAEGRNGFGIIKDNASDVEIGPVDLDALSEFIESKKKIIAPLEGRIKMLK